MPCDDKRKCRPVERFDGLGGRRNGLRRSAGDSRRLKGILGLGGLSNRLQLNFDTYPPWRREVGVPVAIPTAPIRSRLRTIHLAHTALAELIGDFVVGQRLADHELPLACTKNATTRV